MMRQFFNKMTSMLTMMTFVVMALTISFNSAKAQSFANSKAPVTAQIEVDADPMQSPDETQNLPTQQPPEEEDPHSVDYFFTGLENAASLRPGSQDELNLVLDDSRQSQIVFCPHLPPAELLAA
jgi:hypothetical protein